VGSVGVADLGAVTRALLEIVRDGGDERALAEQICQAFVVGLDVDGAAISLLTASSASQTLCATDSTAELLEDLQSTTRAHDTHIPSPAPVITRC